MDVEIVGSSVSPLYGKIAPSALNATQSRTFSPVIKFAGLTHVRFHDGERLL